jgi:ATP-dependent RNA helicase RhlE
MSTNTEAEMATPVEANVSEEANVETVDFASLGLAPALLKAIVDTGYTTPTPIQAKAIPLAMQGKDLMAGAQTGTGKTAAFALPILQKLLPFASSSTSPAKHPIRALVLVPTRELAIQVEASIKVYAKHTPLKSLVVFGGVDIKTQTPHLKTGVEILVATPGRLLDHVEQKTLNLGQVQILVLDEADRMLDMGFMPDLKRILALLPKQRQNLMFSATFSNEIKRLADDFLTNPTLIEVARSNATAENVTQKVYLVAQSSKQALLTQLLLAEAGKQVIIFTKTKITASRLSRALQKEGIAAESIHGDKSQKERLEALDAFKAGTITALVATDVAARGLDISDLPMVINYEIPSAPEDYVHRIGRTGRAGASGVAISLVSEDEEKYLAEIEKLIKRVIIKEKSDIQPSAHKTSHASSRETSRATPARSESNGRASHSRESTGRDASDKHPPRARSHYKKPVADPWFDKPYEPTASVADSSTNTFSINRKAPVAALLGGLKLNK